MKNRQIICTTILSVIACFAFSPQMRAACDSPDPGCPGGNLAEGFNSLLSLSGGVYNTGIGAFSLLSNSTGSLNTAVGAGALLSTTVSANTAVGAAALFNDTDGAQNTAVGAFALFSNIGGGGLAGQVNVAVGDHALFANTTGGENTAVGRNALQAMVDGLANTALGHSAGFNSTTGNGNVYIGANMLGVAGESNACYIRSINGRDVAVPVAFVFVDNNNKLGTNAVDANGNKVPVLGPLELQAALAQQQEQIEILTAQLKEQSAQIQKVSAQIEMGKTAPRVVTNKP